MSQILEGSSRWITPDYRDDIILRQLIRMLRRERYNAATMRGLFAQPVRPLPQHTRARLALLERVVAEPDVMDLPGVVRVDDLAPVATEEILQALAGLLNQDLPGCSDLTVPETAQQLANYMVVIIRRYGKDDLAGHDIAVDDEDMAWLHSEILSSLRYRKEHASTGAYGDDLGILATCLQLLEYA